MTAQRLVIDGMNLDTARGTGIATYAKCLLSVSRPLFRTNGILHGRRTRKHCAGAPYDLQFMSPPVPLGNSSRDRIQLAIRLATAAAGVTAHHVPTAAASSIDQSPLDGPFLGADEIYNSWCLFHTADAYFRITGRLLPVRFAGRPPDVMHWTAPMPLPHLTSVFLRR